MGQVRGGLDELADLRRWHCLGGHRFNDPTVPKLRNLFRAQRAGFQVPPTGWAWAADLEADRPASMPEPSRRCRWLKAPLVVRSGSPSEDTAATSSAGKFLSLVVRDRAAFSQALADVIAALPRADGARKGVVFIQPLIDAELAGVTFFDGFYYEETSAVGGNQALTSGQERGDVRCGHLERGDPHSEWLARLHQVFGGAIDIEWAIVRAGAAPGQTDALGVPPGTRVVLQVRPALFPVRRNETLSLANHKEILGDPPSRWMVGMASTVAFDVMLYFATIEPVVATWKEPYAVELAERAWLNVSAFYRLMDHWGLPRTMITEGLGGETGANPRDARFIAKRFIRFLPRLLRMQWASLWRVSGIARQLKDFDRRLEAAAGLPDLWRASVEILAESIPSALALGGMLSTANRVRRVLRVRSGGTIVTHDMMAEYAALAELPDEQSRLAGLDAWLEKYGHRGPLETDPSQPRFAELRPALESALRRRASPDNALASARHSRLRAALLRPLFLPDEWRERFKDDLLRRWQRLRAKILAQAKIAVTEGWLEAPEDVFLLAGDDLSAAPATWLSRVSDRRSRLEAARSLDLPCTASREEIEAIMRQAQASPATEPDRQELSPRLLRGIGLGRRVVTGTAVRATTLLSLLARDDLPEQPILVVPTLDPGWSVVFPRFVAIVVELGGELSHASILIRETGQTAVVNARGACQAVAEGALLQVDPVRGEVRLL